MGCSVRRPRALQNNILRSNALRINAERAFFTEQNQGPSAVRKKGRRSRLGRQGGRTGRALARRSTRHKKNGHRRTPPYDGQVGFSHTDMSPIELDTVPQCAIALSANSAMYPNCLFRGVGSLSGHGQKGISFSFFSCHAITF